ncbi:MAG TPA: hypothetical protein PLT92_14180 [Ignavibacteriaceae bacterium]|nr:hypothetical protein [Ignavibacteriaceae bacterium]
MTQRTKLEIPINKPVEVKLLYDEPITGSSQYGPYFMYAVTVEGSEYSFFSPEEVHEKIKSLRRGDSFIITKLAAQRGNKVITTYDVKLSIQEESQEINESIQENDDSKDSFYGMMLQSYKDAIEISRELNGMADPEKIAVTLFIARSKVNNY